MRVLMKIVKWLAVLIVVIPFGMVAGRRRTVEDEWESRHGSW